MQVSPLHHLRRNAVAYLALFVALGGTSFAAATVITGKNVKDSSLTGADVKKGSLTGSDVKNKSLAPADFNGSVTGPQGPQGATGAPGQNGTNATINGVAAGGDLTGTYPNPVIGNEAVTGAKVANGTLHIGDVFTHAFTQSRNFVSVPAHGCTGSTTASAFGSPGDIVLAFPPPDLGSPLIMPPTTFGTANELSLKICNVGDTPIDPPAQNYTVVVLTG